MITVADRTVEQRVRDTVAGLSAGDAVSWTSWWHRMANLGPRRAVRLGEAWEHARDAVSTTLPTPYLHASSPDLADPAGPTDDAEWFVVTVRHLLGQGIDGQSAPQPYAAWQQLAEQRSSDADSVRGRIGTVIALDNLAAGVRPPTSGHDNPHYFDDIACVRAVAAGLLRPGAPRAAADLAVTDATVTHALDGVWAASAVAALVAALIGGADRRSAVETARAEIPDGTWCANVVNECLAVAEEGQAPLAVGARLEREAVDHVYSYMNQAPESVGLLLAHLSVADSADGLLLGALSHPRHADGLVPLVGAVSGAAFDGPGTQLGILQGTCVRGLAGVSLDAVVEEITDAPEGMR